MESISLKHKCEYLLLRLTAAIVRRLSPRAALTAGRGLGLLALRFLPRRRALAMENLRQAFPDMSSTELEQILRKNFAHMGANGIEMLRLDMYRPGSSDLKERFTVEGVENLREALAMERGAILLGAHIGFWETSPFVLSEYGIGLDVVAKPMKNPLADNYFARLRETYGTEILNSRKGARRILQSLRKGRVVGLLLDQHISPPGSVVTEFFGRRAWTTTAITNMAMKNQVPVVPVFSLRGEDGRHHMWIEPLLILEGEGNDAVRENTQRLTAIIEAAIRRDPSQWFWVHKRWRKSANRQPV
ncbi:MAG: hypothetical protein C0622_07615 [Desulfuromonas sp.]|nr:MAG: hypothetical protein C0622_07615 [Desulfuromonas sp.]